MKNMTKVLLVLLCIDAIFIVLHILYSFQYLENKNFKTSYDGGYGETFQYIKYLTSSIILLLLARTHQSMLLVMWAILAVFLFLDDWMLLHEKAGGKLLGGLLKPYIDGAYHQGQAVYGVLVATFVCFVGWQFWKKSSTKVKEISFYLIVSLGLLWFSAVVIDYIHAIWVGREHNLVAVLMEEGGEHLGMSLFLWFCIRELFSQPWQQTRVEN